VSFPFLDGDSGSMKMHGIDKTSVGRRGYMALVMFRIALENCDNSASRVMGVELGP